MEIIDTHLHIWDLDKFSLPWLDDEGEILNRTYLLEDYKKSLGENYQISKAVYVEVDSAQDQKDKENEYIIDVCNDPDKVIDGAIISGDLTQKEFKAYIDKYAKSDRIKGVRQVLHVPSAVAGTCLLPEFIENVKYLGSKDLVFEGCVRNGELGDLYELAKQCPDTTIVLDHMGIVDPDIISKKDPTIQEQAYKEKWKHYLNQMGNLPNVYCKISGLNPKGEWDVETLREPVNIAIEAFGEDKIIFASNFPVLHVAMSLEEWLKALLEIVEDREETMKQKLFGDNAKRVYKL